MITFDNSLFTGNRNKDPDTFRQITIPKDATCYICSNSGSPSEPLVSDCSCTDNVAHIKCIANFAAGGLINSSIKDWSGCKDRWMTCTACTQPHQNELSIALAVRLVDFTKEAYPNDGVIIINARILVLREITDMFMSTSQSCYRNKGIEMANDILRRIGQINVSDETIRLKIIFAMASVFNSLGDITLGSGANNGIQRAVRYYEKCLELCKSIDVEERVVELAENGLAKANHLLNSTAQVNDIMMELEGLMVDDMNISESVHNNLDIRNDNKRRKRDADDINDNKELEASDQGIRDDGLKNQVESSENTFEMVVLEGDSEPRVTFQKNNPTDTSVTSSKDDDAGRIEESGNGMLLDDQEVSLLRQNLTNYSHNTEDDARRGATTDAQVPQDEVIQMEMDIDAPPTINNSPPTSELSSSQPLSDGYDHANEHDIESSLPLESDAIEFDTSSDNDVLPDNQVDSSQQTLTDYLNNIHSILSKYNKTKTTENMAITARSINKLTLFKSSISDSIGALQLSSDELESLDKVMKLDIIDEATSVSRFDAVQNEYGTGYNPQRLYLPKLKEEMYNIVQSCKLSPFCDDDSISTKEIHKILVSGIVKGDSASSIKNAITEGFKEHNWGTPKFSSCPILENPSTHSDPLAPIVFALARGSSGTDNDLTAQITKCSTTPYLLVKTGILPQDTMICQQVLAAFNIDRDEVYDAQAVSSFISFLLTTDEDRLVYLSVNEILRIGLPPKIVVTLVLVFIEIHPKIKLLSASDLGMSFIGVVLRNYEFYEGQKLINQVMGHQNLPGGKRVVGPEHELTLDSEITIDNYEYQLVTNGINKTTIKNFAKSLLKHLRDIEKQNKTVIQIEQGIKLGLSHSKAGSIGGDVLIIVDEVSTYYVTKDDLPLDKQPTNIDKVMDDKIALKLPINIGKKKYVIIYLRSSGIGDSKTVFKLAAEQFTLCYAAGVARKVINTKTELIIIFDNGNYRNGELNPGLARAFAYICDGSVLAFISSTSIRCTSIRVLFNCLQRTCSGCKTQLITVQHSSELAGVFMEYQHGRDIANKIRYNTFDTTSATLRGDLCDLLQRLSEYMNPCSRWNISSSDSLFSNELKHATEQQRLEKEAKQMLAKQQKEAEKKAKEVARQQDKRAKEVARQQAMEEAEDRWQAIQARLQVKQQANAQRKEMTRAQLNDSFKEGQMVKYLFSPVRIVDFNADRTSVTIRAATGYTTVVDINKITPND